jgi:hypothetical protein
VYDAVECRGVQWCGFCKAAAMGALLVTRGYWWDLHAMRTPVCKKCLRTDCPRASHHNNPCNHTGSPLTPRMFGGLQPRTD